MGDIFGGLWQFFTGPAAMVVGLFVGLCIGFAGGKFWGQF